MLFYNPEKSISILHKLKELMPDNGILTQRGLRLHNMTQHIRQKHIDHLEKSYYSAGRIPGSRRGASTDLVSRTNQLIKINSHLERLDKAALEHEHRISTLLHLAEKYAVVGHSKKLYECLKAAEKTLNHSSRLLKVSCRTEKKLSGLSRRIAAGSYRHDLLARWFSRPHLQKHVSHYRNAS